MGTWVIFGVWLLINHMVNVAETFTDILKHHFLQTNVVKFAKCLLVRITLIGVCILIRVMFKFVDFIELWEYFVNVVKY